MSEKFYYNVYTKDGELLDENLFRGDVERRYRIPGSRISKMAQSGHCYKGMYRVKRANDTRLEKDETEDNFAEEWNMARFVFQNVKWVKEIGPEVKILKRSKVG